MARICTIADAAEKAGGGMSHLLIFGLIFVGMWFLMIAPGRKRQKLHQKMLSQLRPGNCVLLLSGIFGKIINASGSRLKVEIAKNVRIDVLRNAIQQVVDAGSEKSSDDECEDTAMSDDQEIAQAVNADVERAGQKRNAAKKFNK
jgi:preprotein translocase subunit YajC